MPLNPPDSPVYLRIDPSGWLPVDRISPAVREEYGAWRHLGYPVVGASVAFGVILALKGSP